MSNRFLFLHFGPRQFKLFVTVTATGTDRGEVGLQVAAKLRRPIAVSIPAPSPKAHISRIQARTHDTGKLFDGAA
jgi:hypothetical protein